MKKYEKNTYDPILPEMQTDLVSVCIPVYNVEDYLCTCLDSVLAQSYKNLDIVLVDDGSTDRTGTICDDYASRDNRINVIHKTNGGIFSSRNECLKNVSGEYICWIDGDDTMEPSMIESMLSALKAEDADMCVCRYALVYDDYSERGDTGTVYVYDGMELMEEFLLEERRIPIQNAVWNKLYKKSLAEGITFPALWYEDMVYTLQLIGRSARSVYLDTSYYNYKCDRAASVSNTGINPHTYTDLIPNFLDRSAYLESAGRHDLALISDYMIYKRILSYVNLVYKSDDPDKKEHLKILDGHIRAAAERFDEIYAVPYANPNEYRKMKLYLKSKALYHAFMKINEGFFIPLKVKIAQRKK